MFTGTITALVTPFREGAFDEQRYRTQIDFQIESGIDALVTVGTTGESPTLTLNEHARAIEVAVDTAQGRVPVIAGVGANATSEAIELHRIARDCGASAGLSVNPYYNKPSQEGLYTHFMKLAEEVALPIVLYNVPSRCGVSMNAATVARLSRHSNIVAIKEASGSIDQVSQIMAICDLPVLCGDDGLTIPMMSIGAVGVVSVVSNLLPARVGEMVRLYESGERTAAAAIHHELHNLLRAIFADGNPAGIKHAMKLADMDSGELRLPLVPVNSEVAASINKTLSQLDVLALH